MAKTQTPGAGAAFGGSLKPRAIKHYGDTQKIRKIYRVNTPFGRLGFTRDKGEGELFARQMITTNLGAILRAPDISVRGVSRPGPIMDEFDLGSGLVTNIGVTALANDSNWFANTTENLATLNTQKFINWGTGATAAKQSDWKLQTQAENKAGKKEAVAVSSSVLKWLAKNSKLIITGTLEANLAGPTAITEWGLFSAAKTEGTTPKAATSTSSTSLTDTAKFPAPGLTESKKDARGAQQFVLNATEAESVYGLVKSNTETVAQVPAWVKNAAEEEGTTPSGTSKYAFFPVMWDHRVFSAINVEEGNKIEFPYELTIQGGS